MTTGATYRVKECKDVDFHVTKVRYRGPKYFEFSVVYVYRKTGAAIYRAPETVRLSKENFKRWHRI